MPCSLHPSSQGNVCLISCVRRTRKSLYWCKSTTPRILSWTLAKNLGKRVRIRKTCREISAGCSHSFWYFAAQGFYEISHFGTNRYPWMNSSFMNLFIALLNSQNLLMSPKPCTRGPPCGGNMCLESNTPLLSNLNQPPGEVSAIWYTLIFYGRRGHSWSFILPKAFAAMLYPFWGGKTKTAPSIRDTGAWWICAAASWCSLFLSW